MPASPSTIAAKEARSRVQAYLATLSPVARRELKKLRAAIRAVAPRGTDGFSYGVPQVKLDGKPLVWYAAFKNHTSLFPMTSAIRDAHAKQLEGYKTATGTVQFPLDEPMPIGLVKRLVKARISELRTRGK